MEIRAPTTTLSRNSQSKSGFTLIEVLIVVAIISIVMALALPAVERVTFQRVNSTARKFVGLVRTIRNDAILLNNIYRLSIDFDRKTYWVEEQKAFQLLTGLESANATAQRAQKKKQEVPSNFTYASKYSKKPLPLPDGVVFDGVLKEREGLRQDGVVYINFFPNGFNDAAILYLMKEGSRTEGYSIILHPTLGKVDIVSGKVTSFEATQ